MSRIYRLRLRRQVRLQYPLCFAEADKLHRYSTARKELAQWLSDGSIKRKETIIKGGLEAAEQGLIDLYKGINTGKLLVEIHDESKMGSRL